MPSGRSLREPVCGGALAALIALSVGASAHADAIRPVTFFKSNVVFNVFGDSVTARAEFFVQNESGDEQTLPFAFLMPTDAGHTFPHRITVVDRRNAALEFKTTSNNGIFFSFPLKAGEKSKFIIEYAQKISHADASFPLTGWFAQSKPMKEAAYSINLPSEYEDVGLSYPYNNVFWGKGRMTYYIERTDFVPDKDINVHWRKP